MTLQLPPLRDRPEDIPELAHYMMFRFNQQLGTSVQTISPEALERPQAHPWPGNIRELQSVLREALIVSSGPSLLAEFLPLEARADVPEEFVPADSDAIPSTHEWQALGRRLSDLLATTDSDVYRRILQEFDHLVVRHTMNVAGGHQSRAAELLGISRPTLRLKVRAIAGLTDAAAGDRKVLSDD